MEHKIKAPIYFIGNNKGKEIYAKGCNLHVGKEVFQMPYHIHGVYCDDTRIIGYGKYFVGAIFDGPAVNIFRCSSLVCIVWAIDNDIYALTSNGDIFALRNKLVKVYKLKSSLLCGGTDEKILYTGNLFGEIYSYKLCTNKIEELHDSVPVLISNKKRIHDGAIYNIYVDDDYIMTCSNDRSICVMDKDLNILHRVYNNKDRFFKCHPITDSKFITSMNRFSKNQSSDDELIYYYGVTDNGNLLIFCNNALCYKYEPHNGMVNCIYISEGALMCGFNSGMLQRKYIEEIEQVSVPYCYQLMYDQAVYNSFLGFKPNAVIELNDQVYIAKKDEILDNKMNVVLACDSPIIKLEHKMVVLTDKVLLTSENYRIVTKQYILRNVTAAKNGFIGTRAGYLLYDIYEIKISDDAITDILLYGDEIYLTSRDGCIYLLPNIFTEQKFTEKILNLCDLTQMKPHKIYRKRYSNDFIEGFLVLDSNIYTYSFSFNCLNLHSFTGSQSYFIDYRPKKYFFVNEYFYFIRKSNIFGMKLNREETIHEDLFIGSLITKKSLFLITENTIMTIVNAKIYDKYYTSEISVVTCFYDTIFVGSQNGQIKVLKEYNNRLWEIYESTIQTRILDINQYSYNGNNYILFFDGFGAITRMSLSIGYKLELLNRSNIFYTNSFYFTNNLYLSSSEGALYSFSGTCKITENAKRLHGCSQRKFVVVGNEEYLLSIGDDHRINCYDREFSLRKSLNCHTGSIVDLIVLEHKQVALSLSIDKTIVAFTIPSLNVIWKGRTNINKPRGLLNYEGFYVLGQGYERIDVMLDK